MLHIIPVLCAVAFCVGVFRSAKAAPSEQPAVPAARGFGQPSAAGADPCGWEPYARSSD